MHLVPGAFRPAGGTTLLDTVCPAGSLRKSWIETSPVLVSSVRAWSAASRDRKPRLTPGAWPQRLRHRRDQNDVGPCYWEEPITQPLLFDAPSSCAVNSRRSPPSDRPNRNIGAGDMGRLRLLSAVERERMRVRRAGVLGMGE